MRAHTPGPWMYDAEKACVSSPDGLVCAVNWDHADGRLIAAAPDLLAALRGLLEMGAERALRADVVYVDERLAAARAAIAKAERA